MIRREMPKYYYFFESVFNNSALASNLGRASTPDRAQPHPKQEQKEDGNILLKNRSVSNHSAITSNPGRASTPDGDRP